MKNNIHVWNHQPDDMGVSEHVAKTVKHVHFHGNMMINVGKLYYFTFTWILRPPTSCRPCPPPADAKGEQVRVLAET